MLKYLLLLALIAGTTKPTPDIPTADKVELQAIVIQITAVQKDMTDLQAQYAKDQKKIDELNAQGLAREQIVMKELGLDPKLYFTRVVDGKLVIVKVK